jgi:hypothetical protein
MRKLFVAAIAAMRDRSSSAQVLAMHGRGVITCGEVLSAAWQACYDRPELQAELIRQFRAHPSEFIPSLVGDGLADLAAQAAARRAAGGGDAQAERVPRVK